MSTLTVGCGATTATGTSGQSTTASSTTSRTTVASRTSTPDPAVPGDPISQVSFYVPASPAVVEDAQLRAASAERRAGARAPRGGADRDVDHRPRGDRDGPHADRPRQCRQAQRAARRLLHPRPRLRRLLRRRGPVEHRLRSRDRRARRDHRKPHRDGDHQPEAIPEMFASTGRPAASMQSERLSLLRFAVDTLRARPKVTVYLDAGNPGWIIREPPRRAAARRPASRGRTASR